MKPLCCWNSLLPSIVQNTEKQSVRTCNLQAQSRKAAAQNARFHCEIPFFSNWHVICVKSYRKVNETTKERTLMATTTNSFSGRKIVGALFDEHHKAQQAVEDLLEGGYSRADIAVLVQVDEKQDRKARKEALKAVGYEDPDRIYFDKSIEEGKTLVSVTNVDPKETGKIVSILDHNGAHYNPNGDRNVRDDVVGMTSGAAIGAAAGAFAGPVGAAIGCLAGAAVGAVAGAAMEQRE